MDVADSRTMETKQLLKDLKSGMSDLRSDRGSFRSVVASETQIFKDEVGRLYGLAKATSDDILRIDANMDEIKTDVAGLKSDVAGLKPDVAGFPGSQTCRQA